VAPLALCWLTVRRSPLLVALLPLVLALGCHDDEARAPDEGITYAADIAPLLDGHCVGCHRSGGAAPFPLTTYADAASNAPGILSMTEARAMPPWAAEPTDECAPRRPFVGDPRLRDEEIDLVRRWVAGGSKKGSAGERPSVPLDSLDDATDSFDLPEHALAAGAGDEMRCFVVDPALGPAWIDAVEFLPRDAAVVHHAQLYSDSLHSALDLAPVGGEFDCFGGLALPVTLVASWTPGRGPVRFPARTALEVLDRSLFVVQVHYHARSDRGSADRLAIRLHRTEAPEWRVDVRFAGNATGGESKTSVIQLLPGPDDPPEGPAFLIPAGKAGHVEEMEITVPDRKDDFSPLRDWRIAAVANHMHLAGTAMQFTVDRGGEAECLLATPRYEFQWQRLYFYDAPIEDLPVINPGDKLRIRCTYDNTMDNPFIRDALRAQHLTEPRPLRFGETTLDEMCNTTMVLLEKNPGYRADSAQ
jgi:mono/diheme cytochrome c family protein